MIKFDEPLPNSHVTVVMEGERSVWISCTTFVTRWIMGFQFTWVKAMHYFDFRRFSWIVVLMIFTVSCGDSSRDQNVAATGDSVLSEVDGSDSIAIPTIRI